MIDELTSLRELSDALDAFMLHSASPRGMYWIAVLRARQMVAEVRNKMDLTRAPDHVSS